MLGLQPGCNLPTQTDGRGEHLVGLVVGYGADLVVDGSMALSPAPIQERNGVRVDLCRELETLERAHVLVLAFGMVAGRRESGRRELKGRVVGDVEPPFGAETRSLALLDVAIGDGQESRDLVAGRGVLTNPAVAQIERQGHLCRQ